MSLATLVFVSHSAELNGAELMLFELIKHLDSRKFQKVLVVPRHGRFFHRAVELGIQTRVIPQKWWVTSSAQQWRQPLNWALNLAGLIQLASFLKSKSPRVVISNSSVALGGALAARLNKLPHIWIVHELLDHPQAVVKFIGGNKLLASIIGHCSNLVIANSRVTARPFQPFYPVEIIYNGVDLGEVQKKIYRLMAIENQQEGSLDQGVGLKESNFLLTRKIVKSRIRQQWPLTCEDQLLGVVGKFKREKGQDMALRALAILKDVFPKLKLIFIGDPSEAKYFRLIKNLVTQLDLGKRVLFQGYIDELYSFLPALDILVVPSRQESFSRVVVEAMAVGVPVVAFNQGGIPEIIEDGRNGFLAQAFSPRSLAEKVALILNNPEYEQKFSFQGYQTVKSRFDLSDQVRNFERILERWL